MCTHRYVYMYGQRGQRGEGLLPTGTSFSGLQRSSCRGAQHVHSFVQWLDGLLLFKRCLLFFSVVLSIYTSACASLRQPDLPCCLFSGAGCLAEQTLVARSRRNWWLQPVSEADRAQDPRRRTMQRFTTILINHSIGSLTRQSQRLSVGMILVGRLAVASPAESERR